VGDLLDCRCGWWGWQGSSVEDTTRSDERVCSFSCHSVCWAVDGRRGSSSVWVAVSEVSEVVWVLDTALVAVSGVVATGVAAIVGSDVAAAQGCSGRNGRGWGLGRGDMYRFGSECRCSRGADGCLEAGNGVVVAIVDDVVDGDGGCAGVVSGDVADSGGVRRWGAASLRGAVCVMASAVVVEAVWVPKSAVSLTVSSVCTPLLILSGTGCEKYPTVELLVRC
jgi:hypothetical protein